MKEPDGSQERIAEQAKSTVRARSAQASRRLNRHSTPRNKWLHRRTRKQGYTRHCNTGRPALRPGPAFTGPGAEV